MPLILKHSGKFRDWRELRYREELFKRYLNWRMTFHDLDHSYYCRSLCQGMTADQRAWFSMLFGMTYRTPQAYAYWWHFKDLESIDLQVVEEWNRDNWKRTTYGTDARYNKGHFAAQVRSIKTAVGDTTLLQKIQGLVSTSDPQVNFQQLFDWVSSLYKYGRMTGWITCQCLYDVLHLNIDFNDVFIQSPNNDSSMKSIWNGYCMLRGDYDKLLGDQYSTTDYSVTESDLEEARDDLQVRRAELGSELLHRIDVFKWESIWCQFKRLFHPKESKEYPGHASGDAVSRYLYYREHWPEVNWKNFRDGLLGQFNSRICGQTYRRDYNTVFGKTGLVLNLDEVYKDMPDVYHEICSNPRANVVDEVFTDHGLTYETRQEWLPF